MSIVSKSQGLLLAACALGALAASSVQAQAAPPPADTAASGSDIIVTARRVDERLQDVPISITVFNQAQISNRNIVNTTDLAQYTPSLAVNGRYGPDKSSFAIRGFSQDLNTQPTVAVYFADVVAPRLSSNITSGNGAGVGTIFDLQNIQVLKGPQGTLFGRNTTGGAILIVPQRPTDRFEGYVEGTVGNYDERRVQAVLNVPVSDTFKIRMGIDRNKRDGYLHNRTGIGPDRFNDVDYIAARLSILAELTPNLENYTIGTYSRSDTNGTVARIGVCSNGLAGTTGATSITRTQLCGQLNRDNRANGFGYYDVENDDPNPYVRSTTWQILNTTTWKASDTLTVKNIASYGEARESYAFNLDGDNIATPFVLTYPGPQTPQGGQSTFTEELQLQGRSTDDRLTWQAGGYTEISDPLFNQTQYTQIFSATCIDIYAFRCAPLAFGPVVVGQLSIAHNNYYFRDYAVYGQATYKIFEKLSITAGIRNTWDRVHENADNIKVIPSVNGPTSFTCSRAVTPTPNPGAALLSNGACGNGRSFTSKSHKPTWLIDLDYKPTEDVLLYAKYARGYRGGGVNEANVGAEVWQPEKIDDYEIGAKLTFRGDKISGTFDIDGFWNNFRDQQTTVTIPQCVAVGARAATCTAPAPTGINGIQNVGKSRIRGAEVDGSLTLFHDLRFDFGYSYLDAKVTGGSVPFCDNSRYECAQASFLTAGSILPFAPKNRVTVTGTYTLPLDRSIGRIAVGATFTHTDSQYASHSDDAAYAAGAIPYNPSHTPATNLVNLNLNWSSIAGKPIDLTLFATNVTKQKYWVAASNGLSTLGADFLILGEPRMFGARLKYRFGR